MATIRVPQQDPPSKIDRFLGINEDTSGDTQLLLGESPNMLNYRLTENYKLRKREGYTQRFAALGSFDIQGMWYGRIAGSYHFLFAANGTVYEHNLGSGVNTSRGTLTNAKTFFFGFADKVYMLNGTDYKYWDGTTFGDVAGYIPLVATATPPTGGGTANEGINLLTGKKRQKFSGNASATAYFVAETALTSVDQVYIGGILMTLTTHYTVDLALGKVAFVTAPASGTDNVQIYWTKGSGARSEITANKFAILYGGQNDTRLHFYGDGSNRWQYSGLADGVPSAEYFPALNYREVGSSEFDITDITKQYDRMLIHTNGGKTYYSYYDPITIAGTTVADFPTFPLNDAVGNIAPGQAQLILNNPFSIQNGVYEWAATNVRDERNALYKSKRVQPSLDDVNLSTALTVDWEAKKEYWLAVGNKIWIYNYFLDTWYKFQLAHAVTCFLIANDVLYFGTTGGQIMKFDVAALTDNGSAISSRWEMNFYGFDVEWLRKFLTDMWISLKPEIRSSVSITYQTDRVGISDTFIARYSLATFADANFAKWSFSTNYNPQPFHFKIKAKKFVYFKLILDNIEADELLTVLSINLPVRMGSRVK